MRVSKKGVLSVAAVLLLEGGLLLPFTRSAEAQTSVPVTDSSVVTALNALNQAINGGQKIQNTATGQYIDTVNAGNRTNVNAQLAGNLAAQYQIPTDFSYCQQGQRAAAAAQDHLTSAALAQALAQSQERQESPAVQATELKYQQCKLFGPSNTSDPQASALKALCGNNLSAPAAHARQDRTSESLFGPLQFDYMPNSMNLTNGVYSAAPITTTPGTDGQWKYAAALTYCQHVSRAQPKPPQAPSDNHATTTMITAMGQAVDAEARSSQGAGGCYAFFTERVRYGQSNDFSGLHKQQADRCAADFAAHIISTAENTDCQTNGRSTLQADQDMAYRIKSPDYLSDVVAKLEWANGAQEGALSRAMNDEETFQQRLILERQTLAQTTAAANDIALAHTATPVYQP
ncbi:MAG: hypothetical protein P4M13_04660 [Alphaproteobacteria bacterium]|nr:hypothetical protein [Alphaproteobacteria bacterium]